MLASMLESIPSPSQGVFHLGPVPLRMYAVCIIIGVIVAVRLGEKRAQERGFPPGTVGDVATIAVPFGLIGARLYHVITSPAAYFGKDGHPIEALYVWKGGLGIWGAVLGGVLAGYVVCRRRGISFAPWIDGVGPTVAVAQAIGRFGNYFNQELYGKASGLPWALEIDCQHVPAGDETSCLASSSQQLTYHPTFLYEAIWDLGVFGICVWADKRFKLSGGRVLALYVALYCVGRGWIEALRIDTANHFFGLRINDYVSIIGFLLAASYLYLKRNAGPDPQPVMVAPDGGAVEAGAEGAVLTPEAAEAAPESAAATFESKPDES